jgi:hypothetical protein
MKKTRIFSATGITGRYRREIKQIAIPVVRDCWLYNRATALKLLIK